MRRKIGRVARWVVGIGALALGLGFVLPCSRTTQTCVVCRAYRVEESYAFIPRTREIPTECSGWYAKHVEPTHAHRWTRSTCTRFGSLIGTGGFACGPLSPICKFRPDFQLDVYRHMDPRDARELFLELADLPDPAGEWDEASLRLGALYGWADAGYPGRWADWWKKVRSGRDEHGRRLAEWERAQADKIEVERLATEAAARGGQP